MSRIHELLGFLSGTGELGIMEPFWKYSDRGNGLIRGIEEELDLFCFLSASNTASPDRRIRSVLAENQAGMPQDVKFLQLGQTEIN